MSTELHTAQGRLLTPTDVAELLGISLRTLEFWRYQNRGPAFLRIGKRVKYDPADVQAFIQARRQTTGGGGDDPT